MTIPRWQAGAIMVSDETLMVVGGDTGYQGLINVDYVTPGEKTEQALDNLVNS